MKSLMLVLVCCLVFLSVLAGAARIAHADITLNVHMDMDIPELKDPNAGAQFTQQMPFMNQLGSQTVYISGNKMRTDLPIMSMIVDLDGGTMAILNPANHTYVSIPFNPAQVAQMRAKAPGYAVTDTGRTTTVLGHTARHYVVKLSIPIKNHTMRMTQDILSAQDFPAADTSFYAQWLTGGDKVLGIPLATTTKMYSGTAGTITVTTKVTSIATDPIPASEFAIPAGYTQAATPSFTMQH